MIKKKVVYVQGTWDLFHIGHINILRNAHKIARELIVGVNTDNLVKKHKGSWPVISYCNRVKMLKACKYVDRVIKSEFTLNIDKLKRYKIEVLVLGTGFTSQLYLAGVNEAKEMGIKIIYHPYTKSTSSTKIKEKIRMGIRK